MWTFRRTKMLNPRALTQAQLAEIVADVQAILWQESRMLPDFPREYGQYWNPAKEWDSETVEQIADVLDSFDLKPPDFIPVDLADQLAPSTVIDANELLPSQTSAASLTPNVTKSSAKQWDYQQPWGCSRSLGSLSLRLPS